MAAQRMAPVDAAWLHMDRPTNELIVTAVLWFEDRLGDDVIREAIEHRLVGRHRRFAQRVRDSGSRAWWVDVPDFDAMSHVVREELQHPGDLDHLSARVSALAAQPLPSGAPLWRVHVVDGYLGGTALVARIHHCIADGVALFRVLLAMSDEAPQLGATVPAGQDGPAAASGVVRRSLALGSVIRRATSALGTLVLLPPDRRTGLRTRPGGAKTMCWSEPMPLLPVKQAARAAGATVNDVVLTALSDALHRYLRDSDGTVRDVRAVLPVNLRVADGLDDELGNRFGLIFLRLPTGTDEGADRLTTIRRRTSALKASAMPVVAWHILQLAGRFHARVVQFLISMFSVKATLVVTNVPGPTEPLHLRGHRLTGIIAWPPQVGSIGSGVAVISYAGNICVGVVSDDAVVRDPSALLTDLTAALRAVSALTPARGYALGG